jgi:hypothetical protein
VKAAFISLERNAALSKLIVSGLRQPGCGPWCSCAPGAPRDWRRAPATPVVTAWLPLPCTLSSMNAPTMSFEWEPDRQDLSTTRHSRTAQSPQHQRKRPAAPSRPPSLGTAPSQNDTNAASTHQEPTPARRVRPDPPPSALAPAPAPPVNAVPLPLPAVRQRPAAAPRPATPRPAGQDQPELAGMSLLSASCRLVSAPATRTRPLPKRTPAPFHRPRLSIGSFLAR